MQLHLIRHPAPRVAGGICYGRTDLPPAGDVALAAARILPQLPPDVPVYSSPLQRCRQLADLLHPAPRSDARLQEMDFGAWEMRPWDLVGRAALDEWAADPLGYAPPQGESVAGLRRRVLDFVAEMRTQGLPRAVLVTHAGVMKIIVGEARGLPLHEWLALRFEHQSVVCVRL